MVCVGGDELETCVYTYSQGHELLRLELETMFGRQLHHVKFTTVSP